MYGYVVDRVSGGLAIPPVYKHDRSEMHCSDLLF